MCWWVIIKYMGLQRKANGVCETWHKAPSVLQGAQHSCSTASMLLCPQNNILFQCKRAWKHQEKRLTVMVVYLSIYLVFLTISIPLTIFASILSYQWESRGVIPVWATQQLFTCFSQCVQNTDFYLLHFPRAQKDISADLPCLQDGGKTGRHRLGDDSSGWDGVSKG